MFGMFSKNAKATAAKISLNRLQRTQVRAYSDETQELDALKRKYDALDDEQSLLKPGLSAAKLAYHQRMFVVGEKYLKLKEELNKSEVAAEDDDVSGEHSHNSFGL